MTGHSWRGAPWTAGSGTRCVTGGTRRVASGMRCVTGGTRCVTGGTSVSPAGCLLSLGGCAVSPVGRAVALAWLVVRRAVADDGLHRGKEGATGRAVALARGREGLVVTGERTSGSRPKLLAPGEAGQHHRTAGHEPPPRAPVSPPGAWGLRWPRGQGTPSPASTTCHQGIRSGPGRGARALNSQ